MTANIRVGLAAGECVTPARTQGRGDLLASRGHRGGTGRVAGGSLVAEYPAHRYGSHWPRAAQHGDRRTGRVRLQEERGPVVGASSSGVELLENGGRMGIDQSGLEPVMFSVSTQGSASARYVDQDTGQVTITATYVQ